MIRIRMLKLYGESVCKPVDLIFQFCMKQGRFPTEWKKANVVPVHKIEKKNYRPVFLLPTFGKIFERLIYNNLFEHTLFLQATLFFNSPSALLNFFIN